MATTAHPIANWQRRAAPRREQRALWLRNGPCESISGTSGEAKPLRGDFQQMRTSGWPDAAHFESAHHAASGFNPITCDRVQTLCIPGGDRSGYREVGLVSLPLVALLTPPDLSFLPHASAATLTHRSQTGRFCCLVVPSEMFLLNPGRFSPDCSSSRTCFSSTHRCSSEPPQITFLSLVVGCEISKALPLFQRVLSSYFLSLSPSMLFLSVSSGGVLPVSRTSIEVI